MTTATTSRQFRVARPVVGQEPLLVADFQADADVLVLDMPTLSRVDIQIVPDGEEGNGTAVRVPITSPGQPLTWVTVAQLTNMWAADLDPLPLVKELYAALATQQLPVILNLQAPDCLWEVPGPTDLLPWAGAWGGHAGVAAFFERFNQHIRRPRWEPKQFIAQGNTVAVVLTLYGEAGPQDAPVVLSLVHWITVQNGRISRVQFYCDTFPLLATAAGGRPFDVPAAEASPHYVVRPVPSVRSTDSIVLDPALLETPPQTVRAVRAMYAALPSMNVPELRKVFTPTVVWEMLGTPDLLAWAGERHGPEAAGNSVSQIADTMQFEHVKPIRMIYQGNMAAVLLDEAGAWKATGKAFKTSVAHIVRVDDAGQVLLFRNYINTAWIVEAALGGRPCRVPALPAG